MRHLARLAPLAVLLAVPGPLAAAEATSEEAARLARLFESYLGSPIDPAAPAVRVTPKGESYAVEVDLARLAAPLTGNGLTITAAPLAFTLTAQPDGTWKWIDAPMPPITIAVGPQTVSLMAENMTGEGVFDPTLSGFASSVTRFGRLVSRTIVPATPASPRFEIEKAESDVAFDLHTAAAASKAAAAVDIGFTQTSGAIEQTYAMSEGAAQSIPDMSAIVRFASSKTDVDVRGLRLAAALGLWSHLVAHHAEADFTTGQATFKARLADLLPVFDTWRQSSRLGGFTLESPFAFASAREMAVDIDATGAGRDGALHVGLGLAGFQAQSLFLPKWTRQLIPSDVTLTARGGGWDLGAAAGIWLAEADLTAKPPVAAATSDRILAAALPKGSAEIDLDGNRIAAPGWNVALDGRLTVAPTGGKGTLTVRAEGLDRVVDTLRNAPEAASLGEVVASLELARGFAEPADGGALLWRIELDGDRVSVNGRPIEKAAAPAPVDTPKAAAVPPRDDPAKDEPAEGKPKKGEIGKGNTTKLDAKRIDGIKVDVKKSAKQKMAVPEDE